ncbi:MAG TPA: RNA methyltransferase substrate-binding domain-containing protein, partial [Candidatus Limiplasma sp.]|nr:RNA methyltransferase substrate-binding domain-containing protein [Candidatus Limiplasma sp.]
MQTLLSVRNPVIQAARALQTRKARTESGLFLCEGEHMVGEAAKNVPGDVRTVFVAQESEEKYAALLESLPQATCYAVPESLLQAISQVKTPQGIAATVMLPHPVHPEELGDKVIMLENVQ